MLSGEVLAMLSAVSVDTSDYNDLTGRILAAAIEVHRILGPGLLESPYFFCLTLELTTRRLRFEAQRSVPVVYKGVSIDAAYRIDLIVEDVVVVEIKSVATLLPIHEAQLQTYMALSECPVGLLINFNSPRLMDGVKRRVNPRANRKPA